MTKRYLSLNRASNHPLYLSLNRASNTNKIRLIQVSKCVTYFIIYKCKCVKCTTHQTNVFSNEKQTYMCVIYVRPKVFTRVRVLSETNTRNVLITNGCY